jgi:aspartyl-tRNA(Asn)/glutamyl-tRNA(Gln) amidotransferase subunit B
MSSAGAPVIGLEIHVQLATRTKLFCGNAAQFGAAPNTNVCPVCLGLPGALPVTNRAAVELAVRTALGLGCRVHEVSRFARKNYFYPDLPKGYQITQYEAPLATAGALDSTDGDGGTRRVRIRRVHLEEDAGKLLHDRLSGRTAVDLNRAGVPLVEVVTEPDLVSPAHARRWLQRLKLTLAYLGVSDCDMEKGSLRVDANVSLRFPGSSSPGTRTELKNMNSFTNVERALAWEIERQREACRAGTAIVRQTLLWDETAGAARRLRGKEAEEDYRYFPEPDLPPLSLSAAQLADAAGDLPELPAERERRFGTAYGLPEYDAAVLTADREVADYFEVLAGLCGNAKLASNWVMTEVLGWLKAAQQPVSAYPVSPEALSQLLRRIESGQVSGSAAHRVLEVMAETGRSAAEVIDAERLTQVRDPDTVRAWVEAVLAEHPAEASRLASGDERLAAFLMGKVMKRSAGKADPRLANQLLRDVARKRPGGSAPSGN